MKFIYNKDLELIELSENEYNNLSEYDKKLYNFEKKIQSPSSALGWPLICCVQALKFLKKSKVSNDLVEGIGLAVASMELSYSCSEFCKKQSIKIVRDMKIDDSKKILNSIKEAFDNGIIGEFKEERAAIIHYKLKEIPFNKEIYFNEKVLENFIKLSSKGLEAAYISRRILSNTEMSEMNKMISDKISEVEARHTAPPTR